MRLLPLYLLLSLMITWTFSLVWFINISISYMDTIANTRNPILNAIIVQQQPTSARNDNDDELLLPRIVDHQFHHHHNKKNLTILFIHQNFPAQFVHLAPALVQQGHRVVAMHMRESLHTTKEWRGVELYYYTNSRGSTPQISPLLQNFEAKVIRGDANFQKAISLKNHYGLEPDVIVTHPGWGESLFTNLVWPNAKIGMFCELFYTTNANDNTNDSINKFEIRKSTNKNDNWTKLAFNQMNNLHNYAHFAFVDAGISPMKFQANTFPKPFREKIDVIFDGVDTTVLHPNANASIQLSIKNTKQQYNTQNEFVRFTRDNSEILTFINRNIIESRGARVFLHSLIHILKRRPKLQVIIVGDDGNGYDPPPDPALNHGYKTWKEIFIAEVRPYISQQDWEQRVHFVGLVPKDVLIQMLQVSTVHVYLTFPFVLSWSMIEAMSIGCAIVASNTEPVAEAITHNETGLLIDDFFGEEELADKVCYLLDHPEERARLGANARAVAIERYDLQSVCLPKQLDWIQKLANL